MTEEPDVTGSSIVPAPRGALDSRIRDLVKRGLESLLAQEKHTIEFPADYSLGTLSLVTKTHFVHSKIADSGWTQAKRKRQSERRR
jgi:hypothetical protein